MDGTQSIRHETLDGIRRKLLDRHRAGSVSLIGGKNRVPRELFRELAPKA